MVTDTASLIVRDFYVEIFHGPCRLLTSGRILYMSINRKDLLSEMRYK